MKQHARSVILSVAGIMAGASVVSADVFIACDISARVGLIGMEERTAGVPFGAEGLRLMETTRVFTTLRDGPVGPPRYDAPASPEPVNAGDSWSLENATLIRMLTPGSLASIQQATLDLTFLNLTEGASVYALDVVVEWEMVFRVGRPDELTDTAILFGVGAGVQQVGAVVKTFDGPMFMSVGPVGETVQRYTSALHFEVGRTSENPTGDVGSIQLALTTQGYVATIVPNAGAGVILVLGVGAMGLRRRRA
jgi:hypothetical protein